MRAPRAPRARAVARPPTVPRMKAAEDNSSPREPDGTTREGGERARVVSVGSRLSDLTTYVVRADSLINESALTSRGSPDLPVSYRAHLT